MSTADTGFVGFALCTKALVPENIGKDQDLDVTLDRCCREARIGLEGRKSLMWGKGDLVLGKSSRGLAGRYNDRASCVICSSVSPRRQI